MLPYGLHIWSHVLYISRTRNPKTSRRGEIKKKMGGGTEINDIEAKTNKQTNKESMKQKVCPLKK
jgi:hypothetical protein